MKVAFRVDASRNIGSGHLVRCLTLATELREFGADVLFVSREHEGNMCDAVESRGFRVERLPREAADIPSGTNAHAKWLGASWQVDAERTVEVLERSGGVDWLVMDHYALDARWETAVRPSSRWLMVIDDLADRKHDCEVLLDQNFVDGMASRYADKVPLACTTLLGPDYALLRPQFFAARQASPRRVGTARRIFVFFGGADLGNATAKALHALRATAAHWQEADVLVGAANPHAAQIAALCRELTGVRLHRDVADVAQLMAAADLALGAGGTTTWERCCLGLPSLVVAIAANQEAVCDALSRQGCLDYLGRSDEVTARHLQQQLERLLADASRRQGQCSKGRSLVDGLGTRRVARTLSDSGVRALRLRRATLDDMDMYLHWANDPEVRRQSLSTREIQREEHRQWFANRVDTPRARLWVAETRAGEPVGQVRLESTQRDWQLDYSVDPEFRGRSYAWTMLDLAFRTLRDEFADGVILAEVKEGNRRSRNILISLGFLEMHGRDGGIIRYECHWGVEGPCNAS